MSAYTIAAVEDEIKTPKPIMSLDITVLAGGPGAEREVSLESGRMVRDALRRCDHHALMLDISPDDLTALDVPADVVFIALHGAFGEDGTLQRILEDRGICYSGSDAAASALAMDKVHSKATFIEHELPTPRFDLIKGARVATAETELSLPLVVKPRASGSSVHTFIVRTKDQLLTAIDAVASRYGAALVEQFVDGPELTVGVLGESALPVCQIKTKREFYDYQAKYEDDDTEYLFDIDLPTELLEHVSELSFKAHRVLGCRDFSRVDWMVDKESGEPYIIEVNTIPGLTSHSLLPKAAQEAGIGFDDLCQSIIEMTLNRAPTA